jgi:hypothetical protein
MKRIRSLLPVLVLSLVASGVLLAQDNPRLGTWRLNVADSTFSGTKAPQSETRTVIAQGDGEQVTYEGVRADGSRFSYAFTTNNDGRDALISGDEPFGADTIATTRVDADTVKATLKKGVKTLVTTTSVVSKDGKVTANTLEGTNAQGQPISQVLVWERQ